MRSWLQKSLLLLSVLCLFSSCGNEKKASPPPGGGVGVPVKTLTVEPQTIPSVFEYVGFVQSSHPVEIRARVEGYLEKIAYKEGDFVKKGDLLFELDRRPYEVALDNANGVLAQQEAVLWNAKRSVDRLKPLYEQNAASRRDLDDAISQEQAAEAALQSAKAKVDQAKLNLGYVTIHSPIDGLAAESSYREGALITPGLSHPLTTVSTTDPIWLNFNVSDSDLLKSKVEVKKNLLELPKDMNFDVEAVLANGFPYPIKGKVSFASPTLDQETGTISIRAVMANPNGVLIPGQFIRARVIGAIRPNAIVIPQRAVLTGSNGVFVYVVGKDNKVEPRLVEAGEWYGNDWIILSGLQKGDVVVVDGVNKVQPGVVVQIIR